MNSRRGFLGKLAGGIALLAGGKVLASQRSEFHNKELESPVLNSKSNADIFRYVHENTDIELPPPIESRVPKFDSFTERAGSLGRYVWVQTGCRAGELAVYDDTFVGVVVIPKGD